MKSVYIETRVQITREERFSQSEVWNDALGNLLGREQEILEFTYRCEQEEYIFIGFCYTDYLSSAAAATEEHGKALDQRRKEREQWLFITGSLRIWTELWVVTDREILRHNLSEMGLDKHSYVFNRITLVIERYIQALKLKDMIDS